MPVEGQVMRADRVDLRVADARWPAAEEARGAIAAQWRRRSAESAGLFNGMIFVLRRFAFAEEGFQGEFLRTDFASFLAWREHVFADPGIRDCFGVGILRASDGRILLGRQRTGQLNAGLVYPPAGFIDATDVRADGRIEIDGSIAREVREETGLDVAAFAREPGYRITLCGTIVAVAIEWRSLLPGPELLRHVHTHMGRDPEAELASAILAGSAGDVSHLAMPDYARVLADALLAR